MHGINEALRIDGNREKWRRKAIDSPEWDSLLALTADWPESTRSALCDIVADVFFGRLPEVSPKVRYDAQQLAFREQLSARIAWIREWWQRDIDLAAQHELVAVLTNLSFGLTGSARVTGETEARRWRRHKRADSK